MKETVYLLVPVDIEYDGINGRAELLEDLVGGNAPYVQFVSYSIRGGCTRAKSCKPTIQRVRRKNKESLTC